VSQPRLGIESEPCSAGRGVRPCPHTTLGSRWRPGSVRSETKTISGGGRKRALNSVRVYSQPVQRGIHWLTRG
jgi:hypothetical protein